jgi:hypothetical protein
MLQPRTAIRSLVLLTAACSACAEDGELEPADEPTEFRALEAARGEYFDIVDFPREETGPAIRATGHLILRLAGGPAATGPASPPTDTGIQGTCGVTFVSPEIAVTAGHCLRQLAEYDEVEVRTPRVLPGFTPNPAIGGGVFPGYTHTDGAGHSYDRYICQMRVRCHNDPGSGPAVNCDIEASDVPGISFSYGSLDIGILECDAVDGARHDYVDVAESIADNSTVAVPWYHEVYDAPTSGPLVADFQDHYVDKNVWAENYHYYGGGERHQMLPLMSTDYYSGPWKVVDPPSGVLVDTNLKGCHGTSGSGVMYTGNGYPELIGPAIHGFGSINNPPGPSSENQLCHVPGADNIEMATMDAMHPDVTRYFVEQYVGPSCANPDSFPSRLIYWLACDRLMLEPVPNNLWELRPPVCPWCLPAIRFDAASRQAMAFDTSVPLSLGLRPNVLGERYRASVRVWTNDFPTTVELRMGSTTIATRTLDANDVEYNGNDATAMISASFVADASTAGPLTIATVGQSAAQELSVSSVALVLEGQTDAFDTMDRRVGYGVHWAKDQGADAEPMTFVASPDGGYAAALEFDRRMVATGLALTADASWQVQLVGDDADLRCGLVFADGSEQIVDCSTNDAGVILDGTGHGEPAALFVEHTQGPNEVVSLYDMVVTEVASCQPAHDTCATGVALDPACDGCVDSICAVDSYCCNNYWDGICVGEVLTVCDQVHCDASKGSCTHSVCANGPALSAQCDSPPVSPSCTAAICNVDPYCCNNYWDGICVGEVDSVCGLDCG